MHLIIREAVAGDAGLYRCLTTSVDYNAQLVIIGELLFLGILFH